jgi:plasmid stabilization system protein ParE
MKWRLLARDARDLAEIETYISMDNPEAAKAVAARLRKAFELITDRPEIGRSTKFSSIREWSVTGLPYVIPYRVRSDRIEILRVWHTSRKRLAEW